MIRLAVEVAVVVTSIMVGLALAPSDLAGEIVATLAALPLLRLIERRTR